MHWGNMLDPRKATTQAALMDTTQAVSWAAPTVCWTAATTVGTRVDCVVDLRAGDSADWKAVQMVVQMAVTTA